MSCVNLILSEQSLKNIFFSEHEHWTFISPTQQTFQQWKFLGENINHPSWLMSSGPGGNWYKQSFSFSNFCNNFIDINKVFWGLLFNNVFLYLLFQLCKWCWGSSMGEGGQQKCEMKYFYIRWWKCWQSHKLFVEIITFLEKNPIAKNIFVSNLQTILRIMMMVSISIKFVEEDTWM